jgi:hypothetical protein
MMMMMIIGGDDDDAGAGVGVGAHPAEPDADRGDPAEDLPQAQGAHRGLNIRHDLNSISTPWTGSHGQPG